MTMIGIIDYGMGNLYSVRKALERLGCPYIVSGDNKELARARGLLLPGVGSFRDAMHICVEPGWPISSVRRLKTARRCLAFV